jgi:nicotinamide mononucleotide transporter
VDRVSRTKQAGYGVGLLISIGLIIASLNHWFPMDITEVFGFIFGAWSVWLCVEASVWNWPVGIINAAFYVIVFFTARLYADMSLQVVYIILGFLGLYWWLWGGEKRTELPMGHVSARTAVLLTAFVAVFTFGFTIFLTSVNDSAPCVDALTTGMSLAAQYMLTRKLIENWYVWITADVIYIGLYFARHLYLTSVLYAIFLTMCIIGVVQWRATMRRLTPQQVPIVAA